MYSKDHYGQQSEEEYEGTEVSSSLHFKPDG